MWIPLACVSAVFLGCYDVSKKVSVEDNAMVPTLFCTTLAGAICVAPLLLLSALAPELAQRWHLHAPAQPPAAHLLILLKSVIVGSSWALSYFALKHLPLTVAGPLRATGPLFTVLGAVLLFGERPSAVQWAGIVLILASYVLYSYRARRAPSGGPSAWPYVLMMIAAALIGAASAGYDKYLLQARGLPPPFVLGYFLPYLAVLLGLVLLFTRLFPRSPAAPFQYRGSMFLVGALLVLSDLAYFMALSLPQAKLSVISAIRRTNILISFAAGALLLREGQSLPRLLPFAGILLGLLLLLIG